MSFTWSFKAFAHNLTNPPSMQSGCDITLNLVNNIGVIRMTKGTVGSQTEYTVEVLDPSRLGVSDSEQATVNRVSRDLVLRCDIVLTQNAISVIKLEPSRPDVLMVPSPAQVVVRDTPTGKNVEIQETIGIREEVSFIIGSKEDLDEDKVIQLTGQLIKLPRFNMSTDSTTKQANLINALHEYEAAMASLDRLLIFKHLYNVLELVTDADGTHRDGSALDVQMSSLTSSSKTDCERWRTLYNRTKHIHRSANDIAVFVAGIDQLPAYIPVMRQASGRLLASLLTSA